MKLTKRVISLSQCVALALTLTGGAITASAEHLGNGCGSLPDHAALKAALKQAVQAENTGLNMNMWGAIVDRKGVVCAVAFSGNNSGSQWLGSRAIAVQKASTANFFSLDSSSASNGSGAPGGLALSTANLFTAVQPGGSLFGLQASNPVNAEVAYGGPTEDYGTENDPMVNKIMGGVNVFGGGLALYNEDHQLVGAVGVSGDTSCADHRIGWRTRHNLQLDNLSGVGGVSSDPRRPDNMIFDIDRQGNSYSGFGHPHCTGSSDGNPSTLPPVR